MDKCAHVLQNQAEYLDWVKEQITTRSNALLQLEIRNKSQPDQMHYHNQNSFIVQLSQSPLDMLFPCTAQNKIATQTTFQETETFKQKLEIRNTKPKVRISKL
jgi:hypothetical protein